MDVSDFAAIIEELPIGVIVVDDRGEVVTINRAARRHTRGPEGRPVRQQPVDHVLREAETGRPLALEESPLARALAGQVVREFKFLLRWPGAAQDVSMDVDACPLTDGAGHVRGAVAVIRDSRPPAVAADWPLGVRSGREEAVLKLVAAGQTNRQIATSLGLSENTVKQYVRELLHRHGLSRRSEAPALLSRPTGSQQGGRLRVAAALSEQERLILWHIAQGKTNQEIALALSLSPHSVKTYVSLLFQKLHVRRRAEAAAMAVGLVATPESV